MGKRLVDLNQIGSPSCEETLDFVVSSLTSVFISNVWLLTGALLGCSEHAKIPTGSSHLP